MSEARLADALARLQEHHELHLPLRRGDLLGRLAMRFLWRRQLKWQIEVNLAIRDAVDSILDRWRQHSSVDELIATSGLATHEQLRTELDSLRRSDQNMMAGLNQRLYSAIGALRSELSDIRLQLSEKAENTDETDERLRALAGEVARLTADTRDGRLRHAQLDLFLDELRAAPPGPVRVSESAIASVPDRSAFIELAIAGLLDGPAEQVRSRRTAYLPVVEAARAKGATGPAFDLAPGRGEWLEVLRSADVPYRSASRNPLAVKHCAGVGCELTEADPMAQLASADQRSLGAVTAFRYVERLDPAVLARFVDLAAAALAPGGVLIVETPTATPDFHIDPFALRPVHPSYLRFLVEAAGFGQVEVRYPDDSPLTGWPTDLSASAAERADRYCLLAWR